MLARLAFFAKFFGDIKNELNDCLEGKREFEVGFTLLRRVASTKE